MELSVLSEISMMILFGKQTTGTDELSINPVSIQIWSVQLASIIPILPFRTSTIFSDLSSPSMVNLYVSLSEFKSIV